MNNDKKMTEAEIMNALECCKAYNYDACSECPFNRNADCAFAVATNCLDLLNRKNAKIEDLQIKNEHLAVFLAEAKAEIERLKADKYLYTEDGKIELLPRTDLDKIRAEAIKEFAEYEIEYVVQIVIDCIRAFIIKDTKLDPVYAFNPTAEEINKCADYVRDILRGAAKEMGVEL